MLDASSGQNDALADISNNLCAGVDRARKLAFDPSERRKINKFVYFW
jgi:hypothetical protein